MRQYLLLPLFLFLFIPFHTFGTTLSTDIVGENTVMSSPTYHQVLLCSPSDSVRITLLGLTLHADSGSIIDAFTLSAERLPSTDAVAPMPSGMVNVTTGRAIYRLLPHGEHFIEPATLTMEYDPLLLPHGYKPKDINTCYYDTLAGRWIQLPRVKVDTIAHTIVSLTTHFTDFANAIIKVPEMPETKAFVPTMMQDLPDIDPLDQIPMIAVPEANNNGTAELTYPIFIPQGRNGMQPSLALTYSSSNTGNGPLGVGWSLNMPAITIDTRWGVPRYDFFYETEAYTLNGQPLVMHTDQGQAIPLPHQSDHFEARTLQTRRFYHRDTRMQDRIIRHGQKPDEYWWSVTDRQGVTTYYGGTFDPDHPEQMGLDTTTVLKDAKGNIGYWAITAVIDLYGNYIRYSYQKDGNNLYPISIAYTGNYKEPLAPSYSIDFVWDTRADVPSDARLGFMRETRKRLCHLRCAYDDNPFRLYGMIYQDPIEENLYKTRLVEVFQVDSGIDRLLKDITPQYGCILEDFGYRPGTRTRFAYQDAPKAGQIFSTDSVVYGNAVNTISSSTTTSWDIGGTLAVGLGFTVPLTTLSIGGNYTYSRGEGQSKFMLLDLNGDGLPDQVYEEDGQIKYCRQLKSNSFAKAIPISGLSYLSHEVSKTSDWGVQADVLVANVSGGWPVTDSYTDTYFADVNGDGLPDLVTPEGVRFNHLVFDSIPSFDDLLDTRTTAQPNATISVANSVCGEIILNGEVDERLYCNLIEEYRDHIFYSDLLPSDYGEHDWASESFNGGVLQDSTFIQLMKDNDLFGILTPEGVSCMSWGHNVCDREHVDPNIEVIRVWVAPQNGTISLSGSVCMESDTSYSHQQARHSDGVICYIQKSSNVRFSGRMITSSSDTLLTQLSLNDKDTLPHTISTNATVQKGDVLLFRIFSRNNTDYDRVRWEQQINYTSSGYQSYNSATDYVCVGDNDFIAPHAGSIRASVICNNESNTSDTIHLRYYHASTFVDTSCVVPANTIDTFKFNRPSIAQYDTLCVWQVGSPNTVWSAIHTFFTVDYTSDSICQGERTMTYTPDIHIHGISQNSPYPISSSYFDESLNPYRKIFGGTLHRGWGHFAYNWTDVTNPNFTMIPLTGLYNTTDSAMALANNNDTLYQHKMEQVVQNIDTMHSNQFSADSLKNRIEQQGLYTPLSSGAWVEMNADSRTEQYVAYGQLGYLGQYTQSNTRVKKSPLVFRDTLYDSVPAQPDIITYDSPFPIVGTNGRLTTIRKSSRTKQKRISVGAGVGPLGMAYSESTGTQTVETDYTDLNGDGFPDFIGRFNGIQYSTPWGGIGRIQGTNLSPYVCSSSSTGDNFSGNHGGEPEKIAGNGQSSGRFTIKACPGSVGISQGINDGNTSAEAAYIDVNGDGLPDRVTSNAVAYNTGYAFLPPVSFDMLVTINNGINHAESGGENFGGGIQFVNNLIENGLINVEDLSQLTKVRFAQAQASISLGVNLSVSEDSSQSKLLDINGDGLPDLVSLYGANTIKVAYNTGGHFTAPQIVNLSSLMRNHSDNVGINLALTGGITIFGIVKFCLGVQSTPWSQSDSHTHGDLIDMNGDGYPDWVESTNNGLQVRFHQGARTNLLTSVTNPTGQKITFDYTLSDPDVHHRQRQWNLTLITDSDRLNPSPDLQGIRTSIQYFNPHYDSYERTDYGYETVITQKGDKRLTQHFQNESYMLHGEKANDLLSDTLNTPFIGHRYSRGFFMGGDPSQTIDTIASALCQDADIHIHHNGDWTDWYEGHNDPQLSVLTQSFYDSLYNLTRFVHHGNYAISGDEWTQDISYSTAVNHRNHHLISLPIRERVCGGGRTLRLSTADYNHYGSPDTIRMLDTVSNITLCTYLTYDSIGHPIKAVYPTGLQLNITYDSETQTYPTIVSNSFNETTQTIYELKWGRPVRTIDPAGNEINYDYDASGRLISVLAPAEDNASMPHTIQYIYRNRGHDFMSPHYHSFTPSVDSFTNIIKVMHSAYKPLEPDSEYVIFDARGHELQRKRFIDIYGGKDWITSGHVIFDCFYRPIEQYYPCKIGIERVPDYDPVVSLACTIPTITQYDALDRPFSIEYPDHAVEHRLYSIQDNALHTLLTDANGHTQEVFKSPQDWTLRTREDVDSLTKYQYNPIGELIRVTDADGYRTDYAYDMFGHTIMRSHPDNGVTRWQYGNTGLLESMQTQRLYDKNQSINYTYNHGRLTDIVTPNSSYIHYDYNSAGRVAKRWDASGTEEFTYDSLGNVSRSVRRLAVPTENSVYVFRTDFLYDSYGRMRQITYPDGESVNYNYGTGGLLCGISSSVYGPICYREYDERMNRIYQSFGNGTQTTYQYSPERNWLTYLISRKGSTIFSDKQYYFDDVGNLSGIAINEGSSLSLASWTTSYLYDNRNRLINANDPYDYNALYSATDRIWYKKIDNLPGSSVYSPNELFYGYDEDTLTHQVRVIYDKSSSSSLDLYWDADGNLAQMLDCDRNRVRFHRWNDFDRLTFSLGHDFCGYYGYDADGIRTYKLMGTCNISTQNGGGLQAQAVFDDMVLYPSPYMVVTPRGYTNHYYAGSERIASRIGDRCWTITPTDDLEKPAPEFDAYENFMNMNQEDCPFGNEKEISSPTTNVAFDECYNELVQYSCNPVFLPKVDVLYAENMLEPTIDCKQSFQNDAPVYYYHPDHLGSTSWVTNTIGDQHQFLAYLPYGEPLLNVLYDNYDSRYGLIKDARYKFTGKERDEETGYDYMEQRYYYPPLAFWLRPDPLLDKYIHLSPYVYCNGNPLKYVDPLGMEKKTALNPALEKDIAIMEAAEKFPDHPQILHLWLHAQSTHLTIYDSNRTQTVDYNNAEEAFANYLASVSELWKEHYDNENALQMIVLHSCYAGQGAESIAQHISGLPAFKDILIVAATETVNIDNRTKSEVNTAKTIKTEGREAEYDLDENGQIQYGAWIILLNGLKVNSFVGSSLPIFRDPQRENERYHKMIQDEGL